MQEYMIQIDNVSKQYRLGAIGGRTFQGDFETWWAKKHGKEDPNSKIGAKVYSKNEKFLALDGVSFCVKPGERVGIIGHNGAGKSTLLKLLSRVTAPTSGEIGLNGRITSMLEVGTGFNGELTGRENIYMNGAILGMTKKEIDSKVEDIIEFSECRQFIDTPVKRYSSGMYVKLAFSVAAHLDSEIMIMDEVLAVGDMAFQKKCLDKMNEVSEADGRTILYVSHNMNTIRQLCSRCIVLEHGRVIFDGGVEEAIGLYLGAESDARPYIDYSSVPRLQWLENTYLQTLYAEFVGKEKTIFYDSEPLIILLKWINEKNFDDLCLRIEIMQMDRTPVATAVGLDISSGIESEKGEQQVVVDISALASGKYATNFTFFVRDERGNNLDVDCVHGLYFEKVESSSQLRWNNKAWGSVQLPEIKKI